MSVFHGDLIILIINLLQKKDLILIGQSNNLVQFN